MALQDDRAQFYAFQGKNEAEMSDVIITTTFLVCDWTCNLLFDLGSVQFSS